MPIQTFVPMNTVDMTKERDWPANIGMMDWDSTNIVFTKRSLIEFLKYTGITVDTNFTVISKLPRYAKFGKITGELAAETETDAPATAESDPDRATQGDSDFRPSRRVRSGPGGSSSKIFEEEYPDDALSQAPPRSKVASEVPPATAVKADSTDEPYSANAAIRPSRRVRTAPGGKDSLAEGLWGPEETEFKPTRRVRQGPGGQDSVGSLLG